MKEIFYKCVDSTNLEARRILEQRKEQAPFVVWTEDQVKGRGHQNNRWESEKGMNITLTLAIQPKRVLAEQQFIISQWISLALLDFLDLFVPDANIKWPNDIYIRDDKIAGILIENDIQGTIVTRSIIGIGLNINQTQFISDAPNPISLRMALGIHFDLNELRSLLLNCLLNRINSSEEASDLKKNYLSRLYRYKVKAPYRYDGVWHEGRIVEVNDFGELLLEVENKQVKTFGFKEVEFILA